MKFSFTKNSESDFFIKNPKLTKKSGWWKGGVRSEFFKKNPSLTQKIKKNVFF